MRRRTSGEEVWGRGMEDHASRSMNRLPQQEEGRTTPLEGGAASRICVATVPSHENGPMKKFSVVETLNAPGRTDQGSLWYPQSPSALMRLLEYAETRHSRQLDIQERETRRRRSAR